MGGGTGTGTGDDLSGFFERLNRTNRIKSTFSLKTINEQVQNAKVGQAVIVPNLTEEEKDCLNRNYGNDYRVVSSERDGFYEVAIHVCVREGEPQHA